MMFSTAPAAAFIGALAWASPSLAMPSPHTNGTARSLHPVRQTTSVADVATWKGDTTCSGSDGGVSLVLYANACQKLPYDSASLNSITPGCVVRIFESLDCSDSTFLEMGSLDTCTPVSNDKSMMAVCND